MADHPYFKQFGDKPIIMPVIHVVSDAQTLESLKIAEDCGVAGIWLIEHQGKGHEYLKRVLETARESFPKMWIGLNFLDLEAPLAFSVVPASANGYWSDKLGVVHGSSRKGIEAVESHKQSTFSKKLHFAGVAFKYQAAVVAKDITRVTGESAKILGDTGVVTTSGDYTGIAPNLEKIARMRKALDGFPLAVASGIDAQNIRAYLPLVNAFLVATSITGPDEVLVASRLTELINACSG